MRPFGVWGVLVNGERDDRYGDGSGMTDSGRFVLSIWVAIAGLAVLFAVVALVYGNPIRNQTPVAQAAPPQRNPAAYGGGATLLLGTPTNDSGTFAAATSGRSDMVAGPSRDADLVGELARIRTDNIALRQATELLRGQIDALSERLQKMESRFAEMTGSIGVPSAITPGSPISAASPAFDLAGVSATTSGSAGGTEAPYTQFGMELGTYDDLTTLKRGWSDLVREYPALFEGLDGLATIRDRGGKTELLLVAGPFRNAADAAEHCSKVEAAGVRCLPAFFMGQELSTR